MKREYKFFIKDILEATESLEEFIKGMEFDEFIKDDKTKSAVINKIGIIGEAVKNIPKEVKEQYKDIPWSYMAKMRDRVIHGYFGIDYDLVWNVIKERLPEIKVEIHKILEDIKG